METKNTALGIGLLALVLGLLIGYAAGTTRNAAQPQVGADMHGAMSGMTAGLAGKMGDTLDETFLDEMIVHHEGAIEMAEMLLKNTRRPELVKLGGDIITAQTGEIQMMKEWREGWFGR